MTIPTRHVGRIWQQCPTADLRPDTWSRQKYYYAVEGDRVFRFVWPSDRDLWVAQSQGTRQILRATHATVVAAKEAVECGEYQWPTPEWTRT